MKINNKYSRRAMLRRSALATLAAGLPAGWNGSVYASDAPESPDVKFGIIALTDCSSIVIAHEKGLFKKYGINSTVAKGASWAAIRDIVRASRLKDAVNPRSQKATLTYYNDNRWQQIAYSALAAGVVATPAVNCTYDPAYPRLSTMVDGTGPTTYGYHPIPASAARQTHRKIPSQSSPCQPKSKARSSSLERSSSARSMATLPGRGCSAAFLQRTGDRSKGFSSARNGIRLT